MSLSDAVKEGRRATLEALRDVLAAAIDAGPSERDLASLALRLESVSAALHDLDQQEKKQSPPRGKGASFEERLAARREARQAANG